MLQKMIRMVDAKSPVRKEILGSFSPVPLKEFFSVHLNLIQDFFEEASADVFVCVERYNRCPSIHVAVEAVASTLSDKLKSFFLQEMTQFFRRKQWQFQGVIPLLLALQ